MSGSLVPHVAHVAHVDAFSGASGDMLLGALVDAGADLDHLRAVVDGLELEGWAWSVHRTVRGGVAATQAEVVAAEEGLVRTWGNIRSLLEGADLPGQVRARALGVFRRLAHVESNIRRVDLERVHFPDLAALRAIVEVIGVCAGVDLLGIRRITCGGVAQGVGMTRGPHGMVPVPEPAVLELLRGAPTYGTGEPSELCTPTGAALLAELVDEWVPMPSLLIDAVGYGAGSRELGRPNVLRLVVGRATPAVPANQRILLSATVEAPSADEVSAVLEALRNAGAAEAWASQVLLPEGRTGVELTCVAALNLGEALRQALFLAAGASHVDGRVVDTWTVRNAGADNQHAGEAGPPSRDGA